MSHSRSFASPVAEPDSHDMSWLYPVKMYCPTIAVKLDLLHAALFPTHAKLYLLEPQPSKFSIVLTRDTSGFISCFCLDVDSLSKCIYFTMGVA